MAGYHRHQGNIGNTCLRSQVNTANRGAMIGQLTELVMELDPAPAIFLLCLSYLVVSYVSGDLVLCLGALIGLWVLKLWTEQG